VAGSPSTTVGIATGLETGLDTGVDVGADVGDEAGIRVGPLDATLLPAVAVATGVCASLPLPATELLVVLETALGPAQLVSEAPRRTSEIPTRRLLDQ
jgi:hypothetical protein